VKLKPCPFCGGINTPYARLVLDATGAGVEVACSVCDAEGPVEYGGLLGRDVTPKIWTLAKKRWNTRAAQPTSMKGR